MTIAERLSPQLLVDLFLLHYATPLYEVQNSVYGYQLAAICYLQPDMKYKHGIRIKAGDARRKLLN